MLTPIDIENREFSRAFRGYDQIEVDEFMQTLIKDYEKLYKEHGSMKEKNAILTETLENYKGMESTMQNAILMAQKTAEDIKQNAYKTQDSIVKEAELKASDIIRIAEKRAGEIENSYKELKREMNAFKARMSSILNTYIQLLDDMPEVKNEGVLKNIDITSPQEDSASFEPAARETLKEAIEKIEAAEKKEEIKEMEMISEVSQENSESDSLDEKKDNDNTYSPKKINPIVDELLKKREVSESKPLEDIEETKKVSKIQEEIIIDLNKPNKPYDVFNDETL